MKQKTKRYDDGGSVMDTPSQDMRDPAYRKSLEKSQALEPSPVGPEDVIGLPVRAAAGAAKFARAAKAAKQNVRTFDVPEIGSELKAQKDLAESMIRARSRYPEEGERNVERWRKYQQSQEQVRREKNLKAQREATRAAGKTRMLKEMDENLQTGAINLGVSRAVEAIKNRKPTSEISNTPDWDSGGMKKGGKVSSASTRGDGIAQRGKTKGRLR